MHQLDSSYGIYVTTTAICNIENLKNQDENFQHAKDRVQCNVDDALKKGVKIHSDVKAWSREVYEITKLATRIFREGA